MLPKELKEILHTEFVKYFERKSQKPRRKIEVPAVARRTRTARRARFQRALEAPRRGLDRSQKRDARLLGLAPIQRTARVRKPPKRPRGRPTAQIGRAHV